MTRLFSIAKTMQICAQKELKVLTCSRAARESLRTSSLKRIYCKNRSCCDFFAADVIDTYSLSHHLDVSVCYNLTSNAVKALNAKTLAIRIALL